MMKTSLPPRNEYTKDINPKRTSRASDFFLCPFFKKAAYTDFHFPFFQYSFFFSSSLFFLSFRQKSATCAKRRFFPPPGKRGKVVWIGAPHANGEEDESIFFLLLLLFLVFLSAFYTRCRMGLASGSLELTILLFKKEKKNERVVNNEW